jgi:hypothetical protein
MDRLDTFDQATLIKATQKVADYVSAGGMSPTEALYKVAADHKMTPIMVKRAAEAYNKSKSVDHFTKTAAGDDRAKPFPIADSAAVIRQIYTPEQKVASETILPTGDFSKLPMAKKPTEVIEKAASTVKSIQVTPLPESSVKRLTEKHASLCERFTKHIDTKVALSKTAFLRAIDNACDHIQTVPENELRKVAQLITNGYHKDSEKLASKMLAIVSEKTRRDIPQVEKTANAAIFPNCEPYISLNQLKEAAFDYYRSIESAEVLKKEASVTEELYKEYLKSRQIAGPDPQATDVLMNVVDPEIINNLEKQKARTRLMELMLRDEDFANYDVDNMLKAYQSTVGSVPKAVERPTVLKNLMLKNLESGGRKDIFEMGQEAKLDKDIQHTGIYGDKELL